MALSRYRQDKLQRYLVKNHELTLVDECENADMGSAGVFRDWLKWAADNYLSDRNVLVIWDHGGDATKGVCYDENYGFKGLKQSELSTAFQEWGISKEKIQSEYPKIDMVIFDTCFMGNIETVSWLKDYFYYMIASEVIMPGGGLDYRVIAEEFAKNDDESYGRIICDSFKETCEKTGRAEKTELSLYDLSQAEASVSVLESVFEQELEERRKSIGELTPQELEALSYQDLLSSSAKHSSVMESSIEFNVMDLKNFMDDECSDPERLERASQAIEKLVCYQAGEMKDHSLPESDPEYGRARCTGLSIYYPFQFDEAELKNYIDICPIENYAKLLEKIYLEQKTEMAFADRGSINADGRFEITLTDESKPVFNYLVARLWKQSGGGESFYLLGEKSYFLTEEQKSLTFNDRFNGEWYHLSGYPLTGEGYWDNGKDLFHARIKLNGEETLYNFLSRYDLVNEPKISVGYVGNPLDENGLVNRLYRFLKRGDVVTILSNNPEAETVEFTVDSIALKPKLTMLEPGLYRLQFTAVALDESGIESDYAIFEVTENGAKAVNIIRKDE